MRVAFHISSSDVNGVAAIALAWVESLAQHGSEDRYLLLSDRPIPLPTSDRITVQLLPRRWVFLPFWADLILYQKLKSFGADLLVNTHSDQPVYKRWPHTRVMPMASLISVDEMTGFLPSPRSEYTLLSAEKKHAVKEKWTGGREFMMLSGPHLSGTRLMLVLQAFSIFKNRQQSGMRLVLPFSLSTLYPDLAKKIGTYKYRSSLVITENISASEEAQLTGAAYALLSVGPPGSSLMSLMIAWRSAVPLLTIQEAAITALAGESALYAGAETIESLAAVMMQIYKDEALRLQVIRNGQQRFSGLDTPTQTATLRKALLKLAKPSPDLGA